MKAKRTKRKAFYIKLKAKRLKLKAFLLIDCNFQYTSYWLLALSFLLSAKKGNFAA